VPPLQRRRAQPMALLACGHLGRVWQLAALRLSSLSWQERLLPRLLLRASANREGPQTEAIGTRRMAAISLRDQHKPSPALGREHRCNTLGAIAENEWRALKRPETLTAAQDHMHDMRRPPNAASGGWRSALGRCTAWMCWRRGGGGQALRRRLLCEPQITSKPLLLPPQYAGGREVDA
jgi:hypothetical protein